MPRPDRDSRPTSEVMGEAVAYVAAAIGALVGVPATLGDQPVVRVEKPSVVPLDVCAGQATTDRSPLAACVDGDRPQVP